MQPTRPTPRAPGSFSPLPASNPASATDLSRTRQNRQDSLSSDEPAPLNIHKTRGQAAPTPTPIYTSFTTGANNSTTNLQNFSRPTVSTAVSAARSVAGPQSPSDAVPRNGPSPLTLPPTTSSPVTPTFSSRGVSHSRKTSQNAGLFEPTLPSTSTSNLPNIGLTNHSPKRVPPAHREMSASQIAAQAAVMQHQNQQQQAQQAQQAQQQAQHSRQRSQTAPGPAADDPPPSKRASGSSIPLNPPMLSLTEASVPRDNAFGGQNYHNGLVGNHTLAATAAANLVFPRSTQASPGIPSQSFTPQPQPPPPPPASEKPQKPEKSKVKLFSRQVKIGSKSDSKDKPLPSPGKVGHAFANLQRGNFSTTSLESSSQSFYNLPNSSAATIRPADMPTEKEGKEKEKKHHFLSRQKHKLKDDHHLPLSSAMSNSRPADPSAPSSLYNFSLPQSPGPNTTGFKSALDLRHGGRAFRERRKEEKSLDETASAVTSEWPGSSSVTSGSATQSSTLYLNEPFDSHKYGLNNMTHDDAWPFLKAKLLVVFEAEDLRLPVEDLNRVVTMHIQYCLARRSPNIIVDDLRELLATGFSSLDHTLRKTPEDRLIPALVELWIFTFTSILPYMQAVFLPLDLEFSGHGPLMSTEQARDFWGGIPAAASTGDGTSTVTQKPGRSHSVTVSPASSVLEVRRFVLLAFRDIVILPRYDTLKAMFSRLSLEFLPQSLASMALGSPPLPIPSPGYHNQSINQQLSNSPSDHYASTSLPSVLGQYRPGTATSLDPSVASYNSTGSTLLGDSSGSGNRSRAISNVSFGSDSAAHPLRPFTPSSMHAVTAAANSTLNLALHTTISNNTTTSHHGGGPGSIGSLREQNVEDSKQVTEMVGRMLQCMSVLASVGVTPVAAVPGNNSSSNNNNNGPPPAAARDEEEGNKMVEELNKLLKLNWLGRGRTGRNRRGMVGGRATKRGGVLGMPPPPLPLPPPLLESAGSGSGSSMAGSFGAAGGGGGGIKSVLEEGVAV
ncbi:HbrB-like-domain-containing protein [Chaetomium tenue]|uniref:HbrB-like-domain-containing protein n=1 Tax=Chaetomium tenue TaxID=1854479 RepID=A0ACB7PJX9_9PEZI|nr:HbrB-like-domain-containing protein [Chaetomium globosum]